MRERDALEPVICHCALMTPSADVTEPEPAGVLPPVVLVVTARASEYEG